MDFEFSQQAQRTFTQRLLGLAVNTASTAHEEKLHIARACHKQQQIAT